MCGNRYMLYIDGRSIGSDSLEELFELVEELRSTYKAELQRSVAEATALREQVKELTARLTDAGNARLQAEHTAAIAGRDQALRDLAACRKRQRAR